MFAMRRAKLDTWAVEMNPPTYLVKAGLEIEDGQAGRNGDRL